MFIVIDKGGNQQLGHLSDETIPKHKRVSQHVFRSTICKMKPATRLGYFAWSDFEEKNSRNLDDPNYMPLCPNCSGALGRKVRKEMELIS